MHGPHSMVRNNWWFCPLWSDSVIKLVSVLFAKYTTLMVTKCWPMETRLPCLFYTILSHNLGRSSEHHRWICNNPFPSWPVFSWPSWAGKVHSCPLFDIVFPSLLLSAFFLFPFTVPCRIVFAKPEDLETWPNDLSFRFLTRVRGSSYSPVAAWIFLRTSLLVWNHHLKQLLQGTWSLLQCPTSVLLPLSLSGCRWHCLSSVWSFPHWSPS